MNFEYCENEEQCENKGVSCGYCTREWNYEERYDQFSAKEVEKDSGESTPNDLAL